MSARFSASIGTLANWAGRILRRTDPRWLYWSVYYPFNFGDWIGPFLYERMSGHEPWFAMPSNLNRKTVIMSAGSIMAAAKGNCVIWGSGIHSVADKLSTPGEILAVRGPYTRDACRKVRISCPDIFGDPGILLPIYYQPTTQPLSCRLGIIPHFRDIATVRNRYSHNHDVSIIDVRHPIEEIIANINTCELIVSSSLHGIIVSNAYGKKAGWVEFGKNLRGDGIKFLDYYASLGEFDPACLHEAHRLEVNELVDFAKTIEPLSVNESAERLLKACPFPNISDRKWNLLS